MLRFRSVLVSVPCVLAASLTFAGDVPTSKQTKSELYVTASEAAVMLEDPSVLLVDIRTRAEVSFLGLPTRADKHIPFMVMPRLASFDAAKGVYALEANPDFPDDFATFMEDREAGPDTTVILMCRSGSRSARAADMLADLGFTRVYSMIDGYEGDKAKDGDHAGERVMNGWRNAGMEWSYTISISQAYDADLW